ncbi:hypothetical protein V1264_002950 [Littorina saxatilis]
MQNVRQKSPGIFLVTSSSTAFLAHCQAKEKLDLQAPDASKLSQEFLLKAASAQTADAVSTLLSQTAHSLIEAEKKYRFTVEALIKLLEYHLTVLGNPAEEDRVWDIILQGRAGVEKYEKHIKELLMLYSCVQKLVDASAEVAFLAGSEFTSTSLGERSYNVQRHLDIARKESQQMESQLRELQAHCIEVIAEHAKKEELKKKAEDEFFGEDESEESETAKDNEHTEQEQS